MRILIADDDETLRELLTMLLTRNGHEVVAAKDGEAAFREFMTTHGNEYDAIITDYQMPRKNGIVLIMDVRAVDPEMKCILVTGTPPEDADLARWQADCGYFPVLQKPYRNEALLDLLK
jgi:DNA-binding NtrC family response regulator